MTRLELAERAARLREQGMTVLEIAVELGVSRSYASELLVDPDGSKGKARKRRYAGTCERCGGPTNGSNGRAAAAKVCGSCSLEDRRRRSDLRADRVLALWEAGVPGTGIAAELGLTYDQVRTVVEGRRAKGDPRTTRHRRVNRELWPLIERRWREGATAKVIAAETGATVPGILMAVQRMRRAGIDLPMRTAQRDEEVRDRIERLWAEGRTAREIAAEIDRSRVAVSELVRQMRREGRNLAARRPRRKDTA